MKPKSIEDFDNSLHGETLKYCEDHGITPSNTWDENDDIIEPWKTARAIFKIKQAERAAVLDELEAWVRDEFISEGYTQSVDPQSMINMIREMRGGNNENDG